MQELLLFAQTPASRQAQLLNILAGVAGMQPVRVIERHLIFKPNRSPGVKTGQIGASQGIQSQQSQALQGQLQGELFYLHLVGLIDDTTIPNQEFITPQDGQTNGIKLSQGDGNRRSVNNAGHFEKLEDTPAKPKWCLRYNDWPEAAGRRPVTSRSTLSVDISEGNPFKFMEALGYSFVSEYLIEGHRLVYNNISILLHRVLRFPSESAPRDERSSTNTTVAPTATPRSQLPPLDVMVPVDTSDSFILQTFVHVQDGSKPESMAAGINELKGFKDLVKGVVDLEIGDRLALDTRVK
ncbi:MAG: Mediator of RNA polymerase II transcription subunit 18 [Piccolia ochrophora]|nr:MAG: Mediator of RNA polymerase II transcription subunit 18 [Piccolia ochrophora]